MLSNIVDCDPGALYCDMPVVVYFQEVGSFRLPLFRPAGQA